MSQYNAKISWRRAEEEDFIRSEYSRAHQWSFDGGVTVPASSSPHIVPIPYSVEANVDPEEAYVASISSCHMLFFLSIAAKRRFVIDEYIDNAVGIMAQDDSGRLAITKVILRPQISFSGDKQPSAEQIKKLHHQSHDQCFIANSVRSEIVIETPKQLV